MSRLPHTQEAHASHRRPRDFDRDPTGDRRHLPYARVAASPYPRHRTGGLRTPAGLSSLGSSSPRSLPRPFPLREGSERTYRDAIVPPLLERESLVVTDYTPREYRDLYVGLPPILPRVSSVTGVQRPSGEATPFHREREAARRQRRERLAFTGTRTVRSPLGRLHQLGVLDRGTSYRSPIRPQRYERSLESSATRLESSRRTLATAVSPHRVERVVAGDSRGRVSQERPEPTHPVGVSAGSPGHQGTGEPTVREAPVFPSGHEEISDETQRSAQISAHGRESVSPEPELGYDNSGPDGERSHVGIHNRVITTVSQRTTSRWASSQGLQPLGGWAGDVESPPRVTRLASVDQGRAAFRGLEPRVERRVSPRERSAVPHTVTRDDARVDAVRPGTVRDAIPIDANVSSPVRRGRAARLRTGLECIHSQLTAEQCPSPVRVDGEADIPLAMRLISSPRRESAQLSLPHLESMRVRHLAPLDALLRQPHSEDARLVTGQFIKLIRPNKGYDAHNRQWASEKAEVSESAVRAMTGGRRPFRETGPIRFARSSESAARSSLDECAQNELILGAITRKLGPDADPQVLDLLQLSAERNENLFKNSAVQLGNAVLSLRDSFLEQAKPAAVERANFFRAAPLFGPHIFHPEDVWNFRQEQPSEILSLTQTIAAGLLRGRTRSSTAATATQAAPQPPAAPVPAARGRSSGRGHRGRGRVRGSRGGRGRSSAARSQQDFHERPHPPPRA